MRRLYERIQAKQTVCLKPLFGGCSRFESIVQFAVDDGAAVRHRLFVGCELSVQISMTFVTIMEIIVDEDLVETLVGL